MTTDGLFGEAQAPKNTKELLGMAKSIGSSTTWLEKRSSACSELLPSTHPWFFSELTSRSLHNLCFPSLFSLVLCCFFSLQCLFISAYLSTTSTKPFFFSFLQVKTFSLSLESLSWGSSHSNIYYIISVVIHLPYKNICPLKYT